MTEPTSSESSRGDKQDVVNKSWKHFAHGPLDETERSEVDAQIIKLQRLADALEPNANFSAILREELMETTFNKSLTGTRSVAPSLPSMTRNRQLPLGERTRAARVSFGTLGTLALVALAIFGTVLFNRQTHDGGHYTGQLPLVGTPTASATPFSCPNSQMASGKRSRVATATFGGLIPTDASSAENWQMQGWTIAQGSSTVFSQPGSSVAVDFVLDGFYSATFGSTASVARHAEGGGSTITTIQPGNTVDLTFGDAVSFDPSKSVEITNASQAVELKFKRALFTVESAGTTAPLIDGAAVHLDGSGKLPPVIGTIGSASTSTIRLDFVLPSPQVTCVGIGSLNSDEPIGATDPTNVAGSGYVLTLGLNEG